MTRLTQAFRSQPLFMPYYPVGFPNFSTSLDVLEALAKNGADLLEVGMSFSDPLADGAVIQHATQKALEAGFSTPQALQAIEALRHRGVEIPLLLMGYYNPILSYGLEAFIAAAQSAGADGFIIPDLPPEEAQEFTAALKAVFAREAALSGGSGAEEPLPLIRMLAPTTSPQRMEQIARQARGFIYLVSVTGVTGARSGLPAGLPELLGQVRQHTALPVCVGFGISTPSQAREVAALADGVIVGSACIRAIQANAENPAQAAAQFARQFAQALGR